ncbi:MAG: FtsX-like permease family protein [Acidobacteria bacterium]|nr:MAG: FtsX-like permease family protein [Acidobacteriota bacterium]
MIKHLLKLVWNRKRGNVLITLEIFACFLVLFATVAMIGYYANNYRQPLGFEYENVWSVGTSLSTLADLERGDKELMKKYTSAFHQAMKNMPEIEAAATIGQAPYTLSWNSRTVEYKGKKIDTTFNMGSDDLARVLNLKVVRGRWFSPADDGLTWEPVLINQKLAAELFGSEDPLGKDISEKGKEPARQAGSVTPASAGQRVIGVILDFRKDGELSAPETYVFTRALPGKSRGWDFLIKVRPGITRAFEETLVRRLHSINPDWDFEIDPVTQMRESRLGWQIAPMAAAAIVVSFLMIMVALGLIGVVWQSVSQRTREIGLRRACGAPAGSIHLQVLGELFVISSVGLALGTLLVVQIPLLDLFGFLTMQVYIYSLFASLAVIYALTLLCGLYPSRLATRVQPVEALRWE